jgi:4-alpha-glucanotransferase
VLGALGVDASSPERVDLAIAHVEDMPWRRVLPPVLVVREGLSIFNTPCMRLKI